MHRRTRRAGCVSVAAFLAATLVVALPTPAPASAAPAACVRERVGSTSELQTLANRRSERWGGADLVDTVRLPDGRDLFVFGDTLFAATRPDGSRGKLVGFANNTAWAMHGECAGYVVGPARTSWIPTNGGRSIFWPGSAAVAGNELVVYLGRVLPEGIFGEAVGRDVATLSLPDLKVRRISRAPYREGAPTWGVSSVVSGGHLYAIGSRQICRSCGYDVYVSRVASRDRHTPAAYRYWTGATWSASMDDAAPIIPDGAGSNLSIERYRGGWLIVSKEAEILSPDVRGWWAPEITGPWTSVGTLYRVRQPQPWNATRYSDGIFTYMASAMPWIQTPGGFVVAYNVGSFDPRDGVRDARMYGPRFVSVDVPTIAGMSSRPRPPAPGVQVLHGGGTVEGFAAPKIRAPATRPASPAGWAARPDRRGGWIVEASGRVTPTGTAPSYGSAHRPRPSGYTLDIAATPSGRGYWVVGTDGAVYAFGDARHYGTLFGARLRSHVTAIEPTPSGRGYWLMTSAGKVFAFGNARWYGGVSGRMAGTARRIVANPKGGGYWIVTTKGQVFGFGSARRYGGISGRSGHDDVVALVPVPDGKGYRLVDRDGRMYHFGTSRGVGSRAFRGSATVIDAG